MRFFYVRLRTYAQYTLMNEFTCSEHSVIRTRRLKTRSTGKLGISSRVKYITLKRTVLLCRDTNRNIKSLVYFPCG